MDAQHIYLANYFEPKLGANNGSRSYKAGFGMNADSSSFLNPGLRACSIAVQPMHSASLLEYVCMLLKMILWTCCKCFVREMQYIKFACYSDWQLGCLKHANGCIDAIVIMEFYSDC